MGKAIFCTIATSALLAPSLVQADNGWAKFASGPGATAFLAAGVLLPLERDHAQAREHALRALDSLTVSVVLSEGLKSITHVKRPDSNEHDSFPSGHATAAFSVAAMESSFHPKEAPLWYAGAAAIADSRIVLHRHHWSDVIAGAALGYGTSQFELSRRKGILIQPWMDGPGSVGLIASAKF
jgi:membrane-associated phospholipid phosphatase